MNSEVQALPKEPRKRSDGVELLAREALWVDVRRGMPLMLLANRNRSI
jgi:hypothetical protein